MRRNSTQELEQLQSQHSELLAAIEKEKEVLSSLERSVSSCNMKVRAKGVKGHTSFMRIRASQCTHSL